jgi:hypothetical protein
VKIGCFVEAAEFFDSPDEVLPELVRTFELVFVSSVAFISSVDESSSAFLGRFSVPGA